MNRLLGALLQPKGRRRGARQNPVRVSIVEPKHRAAGRDWHAEDADCIGMDVMVTDRYTAHDPMTGGW